MTSKSSPTTKRKVSIPHTGRFFRPVHPGEVLGMEMAARDLSASALALALRVPSNRITEIVKGRRAISAETALRLGRYLGTGAHLWVQLQANYDLDRAQQDYGPVVEREVQPPA